MGSQSWNAGKVIPGSPPCGTFVASWEPPFPISCVVWRENLNVPIYDKRGRRIVPDSVRIDSTCYFGDTVFKIRARADGDKNEQVYWVRDLLADKGKPEIQDLIDNARRKS